MDATGSVGEMRKTRIPGILFVVLLGWNAAVFAQNNSPAAEPSAAGVPAPSSQQSAPPSNAPVVSNDAAVGFVGTLIGAGIGALISLLVFQLTVRVQERREQRQRRLETKVTRRLVSAEIEHNLKMMAD